MKHVWMGAVAVSVLAACSGNPFLQNAGTDTGTTDPAADGIPSAIQSDLGSFSFNATTGELTISGLTLEADELSATYTRKPGLDQGPYQAYTTQDNELSRHSTAFVRSIDGTSAVVVVTGGQFGQYFGGAAYARTSTYDPVGSNTTPDGGLVSYAGTYVGLLNVAGDGGDLITPTTGADPNLLPSQAAEITGVILVNADFTDNSVNGRITNRVIPDLPAVVPEDLDLEATAIQADGTFTGNVTQAMTTRGTYGGIFGGVESAALAGALEASDHISTLSDEDEYGIFVLVQCGQPGDDPICP